MHDFLAEIIAHSDVLTCVVPRRHKRNALEFFHYLLFFVCLLSRVATSIFHIEDIDSLRFALSLHEFNVLKLQPHFPGYPVFIGIAKGLYFITKSMGITFSIIGGLSLFALIIFTLKLFYLKLNSVQGLLCTSLLFLNPFFWLMSNVTRRLDH